MPSDNTSAQNNPVSLLSLPTELRLQIYSYFLPIQRQRYEIIYRSPSRSHHGLPKAPPHLPLLSICHRIRQEVLDAACANEIFIIEASLYSKSFGGLSPLGECTLSNVWLRQIKKVVLFSMVDVKSERKMRFGDLRVLQEMVGLRELRVVVGGRGDDGRKGKGDREGVEEENVRGFVKAVLEALPAECGVSVGASEVEKEEFLKKIGRGLEYAFDEGTNGLLKKSLSLLNGARRGIFSGCDMDHSSCGRGNRCTGQACVNSYLGGVTFSIDSWEPDLSFFLQASELD